MSAYVDCELPGVEMLAVRQHLSDCKECEAEFEDLLKIKRAFGAMSPRIPAPDLPNRILQCLDQVSHPAHERWLTLISQRVCVMPRLRTAAVGVMLFAALFTLRAGSFYNSTSYQMAQSPPAIEFGTAAPSIFTMPAAETSSFGTILEPEQWEPSEVPTMQYGGPVLTLATYPPSM